NVVFVYAEKEAVLTVPNAALRFRPASAPAASASAGSEGKGGDWREAKGEAKGEARGDGPAPAHSGRMHGGQGGPGGPGGPGDGSGAPSAGGSGAGREGARDGARGSNRKAVWVLRGPGQLERVAVKTGISDGTVTEILEGGLQEGDQVVI